MNLCNENWNWFYGKRTFIDEGAYIRFRGVYTQRLLILFSCDSAFFGTGV